MIYYHLNAQSVVDAITNNYMHKAVIDDSQWFTRHDIKSFQHASELAQEINMLGLKDKYMPTDAGENVWPRYDVQRIPAVGDLVSYSFNGDSYPDGAIASISPSLKLIVTTMGGRYYRKRLSGCWKKQGGTWNLIQGHHHEQNPSF